MISSLKAAIWRYKHRLWNALWYFHDKYFLLWKSWSRTHTTRDSSVGVGLISYPKWQVTWWRKALSADLWLEQGTFPAAAQQQLVWKSTHHKLMDMWKQRKNPGPVLGMPRYPSWMPNKALLSLLNKFTFPSAAQPKLIFRSSHKSSVPSVNLLPELRN